MNKKIIGMAIAATVALTCIAGCANDGAQDSGGDQTSVASDGIKQSVNEYSWEALSSIAEQISASGSSEAALDIAKKYNLTNEEGALDGTQTKSIQLADGALATAQIVGFYHDEMSDGGKAGITWGTKEVISNREYHEKTSDEYQNRICIAWENSAIRSWLAGDMFEKLPEDLMQVVKPVMKSTNNVGYSATDASAVTATTDTLWLFSGAELCGTQDWSKSDETANVILNAEGTQYKLYSDTHVSGSGSNAILQKRGENDSWWTRSAYPGTESHRLVDSHGDVNVNSSIAVDDGVSFGFCI
ncbi:DUF6273 domain-containing protein [Eggerthella sinensis]|uniref:DUF6273 domain-containing protein n=1 Tax=Eggerthella sinensis TaxID=242230 RepID=UPI001D066EE3|nr:DUF6273 domain-containing protein [Eggerthella sinensis]MCB7037897.1 DUF6273 domain-containing protein [Eggerthella sinensis]